MGTSARNLILLGDPLQLAQVSQGLHPPGSGASVLEHLLGEAPTIPEDRGIFLEKSYRMHPDVCAFISEIVYAGRLHSDDSAARRTTSFGTGIRFIPVEHEGNRAASDEEVAVIAKLLPSYNRECSRSPMARLASSAQMTSWSLLPTTLRCAGYG